MEENQTQTPTPMKIGPDIAIDKSVVINGRYVGYSDVLSVKVTAETVAKFADVSGDVNPIHMDDEFAKGTRFGQRIAHGMITAAFISRGLTEKVGQGGIYLGQTMKFLNPVFIGDTVNIKFTVTAIRAGRGIVTIDTTAYKDNGDIIVKGEATIMMAGAY